MDDGYRMLRRALDDAHASAGAVSVRLLGETGGEWSVTTGDHVERDGTLHLGGVGEIVVFPDSTCLGRRSGHVEWRGGHTMPDGSRLERFSVDGAAMTLAWNETPAAA